MANHNPEPPLYFSQEDIDEPIDQMVKWWDNFDLELLELYNKIKKSSNGN